MFLRGANVTTKANEADNKDHVDVPTAKDSKHDVVKILERLEALCEICRKFIKDKEEKNKG